MKSQVILDEQHRVCELGVGATAYFVKAAKKGGKKGGGKSDTPKKKCTHCKIRGHEAIDCRKLKREQEEAKAKASGDTAKPKPAGASAKVAVAEEEPESDSDPVRLF